MSCTTPWEYEQKPGGSGPYDADKGYDDPLVDGNTAFYNSIGVETRWFYEDPIDGCVPRLASFQDGAEFVFMDGTPMQY